MISRARKVLILHNKYIRRAGSSPIFCNRVKFKLRIIQQVRNNLVNAFFVAILAHFFHYSAQFFNFLTFKITILDKSYFFSKYIIIHFVGVSLKKVMHKPSQRCIIIAAFSIDVNNV